MKLQKIINITAFKSIRDDRNAAEQLKTENDYSLTENNQKRISKAIDNLGEEKGVKNIEFLLDVADNLKYGTNIKSDVNPRNDWKLRLKSAAEKSLLMSDPVTREKLKPEFLRIFDNQKPLSEDEKQILQSKENILKSINKDELEGLKNDNIKNLEKNLDYFIVSSEVPLHQKKYILNRFEHFLSPDYKINPQLEDKKTVVLAEMLNDLVITTDSAKSPNTKAINQKQHGMCAAISIARKLMSYEYKPDFVDSILSELDDTENIMVYDLAHLGEKKKVPVQKAFIDFEDAMNKGYRIIDASTTQWMNIADMFGVDNKNELVYTAFDGNHFGTFTDSHYNSPLEDEELQAKQSYYQTLLKAKENIDAVKVYKEEKRINRKSIDNIESDLNTISGLNEQIAKRIKKASPLISAGDIHKVMMEVLRLEKAHSADIDKLKDELKKYSYIPNEENHIKDNKIKSYLKDIYNIEISNEEASEIRDLAAMSNSVVRTVAPKNSIAGKIHYDRKLFNAAAAYRTSMIIALSDNDLKTDAMVHYNIVDSERFTSDCIARYIEKVKNGDSRYINYFSKIFGIPADKKSIVKILADLKKGYDYNITKALDDLYGVLGVGSRRDALLGQVRFVKEMVKRGDKDTLRIMSVTMGVSKNKAKILSNLDEYEHILTHRPSEKDYDFVLNKMGTKNRYQAYADAYKTVVEAIQEPEIEQHKAILTKMKLANGLDENAPIEDLQQIMMDVAQLFNSATQNLQQVRDSLQVIDESGMPIDSANPNYAIIKKMENEGKIIPAAELLRLQVRYDAIDKLRSEDEFASRQGKISDPSLYKYSKAEKETLKKIEKSISKMSSDTNRELIGIYREIRKPLEENSRKIGSNMGMYWNMQEGSSGLYKFQQAKILQQLTDKPYQVLEDYDKALDIIKNSPHSGISGTSVFHTKPGGHAQYISEISEHNGKEILFHDNTWGASEHENVWRDSEGLLRTDYSDNRGGELGYITDDRYRNGNYISNLLEKTGSFKAEKVTSNKLRKLKNENEDYKFALINDIIVPGISEEANDTAASIKDNIFCPDSKFMGSFETKLSNMTVAEIRAARIRNNTAGSGYKKEMEDIKKRLEETPFNKGIKSRADYDALSDNDTLKVAFEKAALDMSYDYIPIWKELAKANTVQDINKIREKQLKAANENFDYAFAKSPEILFAHVLNKTKTHVHLILNDALENNNIELSAEKKYEILKNTAVFEKDEKNQYDGSLKHTIDFMVNKILKQFDEQVSQSEASQKAKEEIRKNLTEDLSKGLYFAKKDLLKDTPSAVAIRKYIDKKYKPVTDEEFVSIYRRLQDMTAEEFAKETSDRTNEDIAFKNITGYDVLKRYKASNSKIKDKVSNIVFQKYFLKDIELSKTEPSIKYKKLQKKVRGAYYSHGRTYDDLYRSFKFSLTGLNYEKLFNKYKDINYKMYGALPSFPKIDIIDEKYLEKEVGILDSSISTAANNIRSRKLNLQIYETSDKISDILNKIPDDKKLTQSQKSLLKNILSEFITDNYEDPGLEKSIETAQKMLKLHSGATSKAYKNLFKDIQEQIEAIRHLNPEDKLRSGIKDDLETMKTDINIILDVDIPPRFRKKVKADIDKFVDEVIKDSKSSYDIHSDRRIMRGKLSSYIKPDVNPDNMYDFFDNMELQIKHIQDMKNSYKKFVKRLQTQNSKITALALSFMEKLPQDKVENFSDYLNSINSLEEELNADKFRKEVALLTGISEEKLAGDEIFHELSSNVLNYNKTIQANNASYLALENECNNYSDNLQEFVKKNIRNDYAHSASVILSEYSKKKISGSEKQKEFSIDRWAEFRDKIMQDLKKFHYLRYPEELLDRFSELCAKDGELANAKNEKQKILLETERNFARSSLKDALDLSSLVEMQEILMNSVSELGNPALAAKKFKNFDSEFLDEDTGALRTLADPKVINLMVRKLLHCKTDETCVMFVEKLGLTDQFIQEEDNMLDVAQTKKKVNRLMNIIKTVNKQTSILQEELEKFDDDMDLDSFLEQIDRSKETIIKKTHNLSRQKNIKAILQAFDNIKDIISSEPGLPKVIIMEQTMNELKKNISDYTNSDVGELQAELNEINTIYSLICKLNVPQYRDAYKYKENFIKKFNEIENYRNDSLKKTIAEAGALDISSKPL